MTYNDFRTKYLGQSMIGTNPVNEGQCVGCLEKYLQEMGYPVISGNAKDFIANAPDQYFEKLPPDAPVQPGYIFVCGKPWGVNPQYNPCVPGSVQYFGHVGIVDQPMQGQSFMGLEQNGVLSTPHKVQLVYHQNRYGFEGILRLKPQEYVMTRDDVIAMYLGVLHRPYPDKVTDAEINGSIGKKPSDWIAQAVASPEWLGENDKVLLDAQRFAQLQSQIAQLNDTINKLENKQ